MVIWVESGTVPIGFRRRGGPASEKSENANKFKTTPGGVHRTVRRRVHGGNIACRARIAHRPRAVRASRAVTMLSVTTPARCGSCARPSGVPSPSEARLGHHGQRRQAVEARPQRARVRRTHCARVSRSSWAGACARARARCKGEREGREIRENESSARALSVATEQANEL